MPETIREESPTECPLAHLQYCIMSPKIEVLQHDVNLADIHFNRIDGALEKLSETTSKIAQMIALHDERLEWHAMEQKQLRELIDTTRQEAETKIASLSSRVSKTEIWRWVIIGGALAIMFLLGKVTDAYINKVINPDSVTIQVPNVIPQKK